MPVFPNFVADGVHIESCINSLQSMWSTISCQINTFLCYYFSQGDLTFPRATLFVTVLYLQT